MVVDEGFGLFGGTSGAGDQDMVGRALVMLLSDRVLLGCLSLISGLFGSMLTYVSSLSSSCAYWH